MNIPSVLRSRRLVLGLLLSLPFSLATAAVPLRTAQPRAHRVLAPAVATDERHYLAFPDVLDLGDEVLVSYKRGRAHASDPAATTDTLRIDKRTDRVTPGPVAARLEGKIMQMGEWVRFPNGDIATYTDAQETGGPKRIGQRAARSTDGGRTFGPLERIGVVDGVEYGYPMEFVVEGTTTWMLTMSFSNLTGGYSVYPQRVLAGQVAILRSEDSGRSWRFVRNLTREFGDAPINESSFARYADGFIVLTRGYDNRARLQFTDNEFELRHAVDLTETYPFITSYIGRPRVFVRDGRYYLIGRNWTHRSEAVTGALGSDGVPNFPGAMKMCLFRIDPATLAVVDAVVLDNAEGANVTDAYYPVPYFLERDGRTFFRVVDYKALDRKPPQIVEFEYLWEDVR